MSTSLFDADRDTHVKIVVVALVAAITMCLLGIRAYRANLELAFAEDQPAAWALPLSPTAFPTAPQLAKSAAELTRDSI